MFFLLSCDFLHFNHNNLLTILYSLFGFYESLKVGIECVLDVHQQHRIKYGDRLRHRVKRLRMELICYEYALLEYLFCFEN